MMKHVYCLRLLGLESSSTESLEVCNCR